MPDIKSCPFCWSEYSYIAIFQGLTLDPTEPMVLTYSRECLNCHAQTGRYKTPEQANAAWDKRVDGSESELSALKRKYETLKRLYLDLIPAPKLTPEEEGKQLACEIIAEVKAKWGIKE